MIDAHEPGEMVWVRGVDYIAGFTRARAAAEEWSAVADGTGVFSGVRAIPSTGYGGLGEIRLIISPQQLMFLAELVRNCGWAASPAAAHGDTAGADDDGNA